MQKKRYRYLTAVILTAVLVLGNLSLSALAATDTEKQGKIAAHMEEREKTSVDTEESEKTSADIEETKKTTADSEETKKISADTEKTKKTAADSEETKKTAADTEESKKTTDDVEDPEKTTDGAEEQEKTDGDEIDSNSLFEAQEEMGEALYFVPHQDDEMLTFSAGILTDLYEGRDVHVVLITDGRESKAYETLKKQVPTLTRNQFVAIRDQEFKESLMALGVKEDNIHIPENRIADGKVSSETSALRALMEEYLTQYPEAAVRTEYPTGEISSEHKDHSYLGDMAITLKKEGKIKSLRMFVDPYQYDTYLGEGMPALSTLSPDINEEISKVFEAALEVYFRQDPDNGYYGIGYLSVPDYLNALKRDRINYYFDYHDEGMIRYAGKNRYETCHYAVSGEVSKESEAVNYAAPLAVRKTGEAPSLLPDSPEVLVYDDKVYAPHQGKGNEETQQGSSEEAGGTIVIAWGDNFPDALSAVSLGYEILITKTDYLPEDIRQEILRVMPSRIIVIGGSVSVSQKVISELENIAETATAQDLKGIAGDATEDFSARELVYRPKVERCSGSSRYETALEILKQYGFNSTTQTLIVTTGENFADALAIAPYAAKTHSPIMLCRQGKLSDNARKALKALSGECTRLLLIGAENVVSKDVEKLGQSLGMEVIRLFGNNRYETCARVVDYELSAGVGLSIERFSVAVGNNFPDALIAGTITANNGSVLFLVDEKASKWSQELSIISENRENLSKEHTFYIFGSEGVVSKRVENVILTAMS